MSKGSMANSLLDGKALAARVHEDIRVNAEQVTAMLGRQPCLAVVLVGANPASQVYVQSKSKTARQLGIAALDVHLPAEISQEKLITKLRELSTSPEVDGILLQLPLPKGLDEFSAICSIAPEKDADGLHPMNQGLLMRGAEAPRPCTPKGVMALIDQAREELGQRKDLSGLHAVVVGRSILVGKPVALMLLERNMTVAMCHSRTRDLASECRRADVLVMAVGRPKLANKNFVKPGAIVIDVGINRGQDGKLIGDVDYEEVKGIAAKVTPVPGGVGPMTITMLLQNTVEISKKRAPDSHAQGGKL